MIGSCETARGLTVDRDEVRISTKAGDVLLDPAECGHLVPHTSIAGYILCTEGEEAEGSQSVSDRDDNDVVCEVEEGTVPLAGPGTEHVTSSMDPDHHRQPPFLRLWHINIEVETVLVTLVVQGQLVEVNLWTDLLL